MRRTIWRPLAVTLAVVALASCQDDRTPTAPPAAAPSTASLSLGESESGRHIVTFTGRRTPSDFAERVAARGGAVDEVLAGPGVAFVTGLTAEAAADLKGTDGIDAVRPDVVIGPDRDDEPAENPTDPTRSCAASREATDDGEEEPSNRPPLPDRAECYAYQWNMRAIKAQAAWHEGHLGSPDVRVYLLDTGIDYTRPDLVGLVDASRSTSLVPATDEYALAKKAGVASFMDFHSHGTAVASLIASNGVHLAGVSTRTTLVAVKILDRKRTGLISTFVKGIYYAADDHADIIHLSLSFPGFERPGPRHDITDVDLATTYAHEKGAVVMVAAGNAAASVDGTWWRFCNAKYVICVSATGPTSATSPTNQHHVDEPAAYTNFGKNTITVAAPGGSDATNLRVLVNCSSRSLAQPPQNPAPCSTGALRFYTTGTTYSAAVTSGLAALVISRNHKGQPDFVRDVLVRSADHLGLAVPNDYYGMGRINVARAMAMLHGRDDEH